MSVQDVVNAFLADKANAVLNPNLWSKAKKWSDWNHKPKGIAPCDGDALGMEIVSYMTSLPYMYKDPDELDMEYL